VKVVRKRYSFFFNIIFVVVLVLVVSKINWKDERRMGRKGGGAVEPQN
jgi:hypothetical protein